MSTDILQKMSYCDPTDYFKYKNWTIYWKMVYSKVSENIRVMKRYLKEYFRTEGGGSVRSWPGLVLVDLVNFANALLRIRQQMKMANRYFMIAKKEGANNV